MTKNKPLPGNHIALPQDNLRQILDDLIIDAARAHALVEVLYDYAHGHSALMPNDPWNSGFWAMLNAIKDQMQKAVDGAELAYAKAGP